jgi:hypothetical protein
MVGVLSAATIVILACEGDKDFEITAGLFEVCSGADGAPEFFVVDRSLNVPHPLGQWESYGFIIARESDEPFELHTVVKLPAKPARLGGEWAKYSLEEAVAGMKSDLRTIERARYISFGLDHDDPMGIYSVTIYANAQKIDTLQFNVSRVSREPYRGDRARDCESLRAK